ncbi:alpha/beta hydrolase family protein [Haloferula sp.]|uniref:alpha/beta hydrolase family protein n=1 Tax=Haloferula sp. TaxID=2497595 RepID=UPI0032A00622
MKVFVIFLTLLLPALAADPKYDPSRRPEKTETHLTSFTYSDREVPLKVYLPATKPAPVILLSHGLGGSREVGTYLGEHWAARGYVVVAMQHPGSDSAVWENTPPARRLAAMKAAASTESFLNRTRDVPATLDQLSKWNREEKHFLEGRLNLKKVGMTGHSFGAVTTQAASGQSFGPVGAKYTDKRIDAALALSPSAPRMGTAEKAFSEIELPMMLMTGTKDKSMIGGATPESRREVYAALPSGSKYELVLKDGEHMAFSDRTLRGKAHRNPNHHKIILALSSAFWDAYLAEKPEALKWLESTQPEKLLEPGDLWLSK